VRVPIQSENAVAMTLAKNIVTAGNTTASSPFILIQPLAMRPQLEINHPARFVKPAVSRSPHIRCYFFKFPQKRWIRRQASSSLSVEVA
jgi:hypothetical protein